MNFNIRNAVKENFKSASPGSLINDINESINSKEENILPGLGVMFEVLWNSCDNEEKLMLANNICKNINNGL